MIELRPTRTLDPAPTLPGLALAMNLGVGTSRPHLLGGDEPSPPRLGRSSRRRSDPGPAAFTLMEVLIAVVAFAMVLAAINGVFYGAVRLRNKTAVSLEAAMPLQQTLAILKRDLANILVPGGTLSGALQTAPTPGTSDQSTGPGEGLDLGFSPGQGSPNFYTSTGIIDQTSPWAEVQKVSYRLLDSTNRSVGRDLFRSVTRNLLPSLQEEPVLQPLVSGVQTITFLFYDGAQWRDTWDSSAEEAKLPRAIKVQLLMAAEPGRRTTAPVELVVPLLVEASTNQTEQATGGQP